MAPKISLLFLAMAALHLLAQSTQAQQPEPVNDFCKAATHKELCTKMVNGSKTMHDASKNAMENTLVAALKLQSMSDLIPPALSSMRATTQESILATCQDNFDNTIYDLELGLESLEKKDQRTLLMHLSAATMSDCTDAFAEMGADVPSALSTEMDYVFKLVSNCLAVVQQK
ncbi:pectinesterase inhibitor-like [Olea europaea subsp. europaea]|uniref:Pectinesterase inhibitor-like n=1 Tax=Olea europaea subsp. europaea TaxID=158383 RepID=A0A8S0Q1V3_OLEEU|nr:pectinesterase inhibitor-like [Olea europaea subsp. europaea]